MKKILVTLSLTAMMTSVSFVQAGHKKCCRPSCPKPAAVHCCHHAAVAAPATSAIVPAPEVASIQSTRTFSYEPEAGPVAQPVVFNVAPAPAQNTSQRPYYAYPKTDPHRYQR